jgi:hypothetical protein
MLLFYRSGRPGGQSAEMGVRPDRETDLHVWAARALVNARSSVSEHRTRLGLDGGQRAGSGVPQRGHADTPVDPRLWDPELVRVMTDDDLAALAAEFVDGLTP